MGSPASKGATAAAPLDDTSDAPLLACQRRQEDSHDSDALRAADPAVARLECRGRDQPGLFRVDADEGDAPAVRATGLADARAADADLRPAHPLLAGGDQHPNSVRPAVRL